MKRNRILIIGISMLGIWSNMGAQQLPDMAEQQLENFSTMQEEPEDDSYIQQLAYFTKHPLLINTADKDALEELGLLNELQIENFISYRRLLGDIVNIYELQAIPGWDIITIRRILPFITITAFMPGMEEWHKRLTAGNHVLAFCVSQALDNNSDQKKYEGSSQRLFFRYRYSYKNLLQYGVLGEKDPGESFFRHSQKNGFDFYSFHFFIRKAGIIQALALGDFTVNMGQGLIQWQSMAFKKGSDAMGIKRQSAVLKPYQSAGEFNFQRGAGISVQKGKWGATAFLSLRKLSAGTGEDSSRNDFFSSFQASGYHRTASEIENKNNLRQSAWGLNFQYNKDRFHAGLNYISYRYSIPLQKKEVPYNLYVVRGDRWHNASVDYSYTWRNMHFFGEAAVDYNFHRAFLFGFLISADPHVDLSVVYRNMAKKYQTLYGNAFTENSLPSNENGIYTGIVIRPRDRWRIDAYMDIYRFPWLKYRVDAPSAGHDLFLQAGYNPDRNTQIITRFRNESKQINEAAGTEAINFVVFKPKQNWRLQIESKFNAKISWRQRVELVWFDKKEADAENGFLACFDFIYRPAMKPLSAVLRFQYFETTGYNSRLYAYENDVLYSFSVPVFFDKGIRYYLLMNYDIKKNISCWFRWSQTLAGRVKSEWKLQVEIEL